MKKIAVSIFISLNLISMSNNMKSPLGHAYEAWWASPGQKYFIRIGDAWSSCSVGFPAWDDQGNRYFITAGHCFRDENGAHYQYANGNDLDVYAVNGSQPVGFERIYPTTLDPFTDISLVQMYKGRRLSGGGGWNNVPSNPIAGQVGDEACLLGYRLNEIRCGTITEVNAKVNHGGGHTTSYQNWATYCAWKGDSGGAVYNHNGALGIESTGITKGEESCTNGQSGATFTPITDALEWLRRIIPSLTIG